MHYPFASQLSTWAVNDSMDQPRRDSLIIHISMNTIPMQMNIIKTYQVSPRWLSRYSSFPRRTPSCPLDTDPSPGVFHPDSCLLGWQATCLFQSASWCALSTAIKFAYGKRSRPAVQPHRTWRQVSWGGRGPRRPSPSRKESTRWTGSWNSEGDKDGGFTWTVGCLACYSE